MEDRCVICGDIIPEGRQVCPICENKPKSELTPRQWKLYEFLKDRGDQWTHAVDIAVSVYGFNSTKFIGSAEQRCISGDIQAINDSNIIQKIIISNRSKGIKIANEEEFNCFVSKEIKAAVRHLLRAKRKAEKGNKNGQMRLVFNSERDTIEAFLKSNIKD